MEWMVLPLKRYADFSGRSRRKEYWMFYLFCILCGLGIGIVGFVLDAAMGSAGGGFGFATIALLGIFVLAIFIPSLACQVRRFHDQDKSGWMVLLGFIPYVGGIIVFIFMLLEGTNGPNRYGDDPKGAGTADVFS